MSDTTDSAFTTVLESFGSYEAAIDAAARYVDEIDAVKAKWRHAMDCALKSLPASAPPASGPSVAAGGNSAPSPEDAAGAAGGSEPWNKLTRYGRADMTLSPILARAYRVAVLIERCGASPELTQASSAAFDFVEELYDVLALFFGEDAHHVLRILGNGQISAGKARELIREIVKGERPELMPFRPKTSEEVMPSETDRRITGTPVAPPPVATEGGGGRDPIWDGLRAVYDIEWIHRASIQQSSAEAIWAAIGELRALRLERDRLLAERDQLRAEVERLSGDLNLLQPHSK